MQQERQPPKNWQQVRRRQRPATDDDGLRRGRTPSRLSPSTCTRRPCRFAILHSGRGCRLVRRRRSLGRRGAAARGGAGSEGAASAEGSRVCSLFALGVSSRDIMLTPGSRSRSAPASRGRQAVPLDGRLGPDRETAAVHRQLGGTTDPGPHVPQHPRGRDGSGSDGGEGRRRRVH